MRIEFVNTLKILAKKNKNIVLVSGDLGYSVFDDFMKEFPDQYLNAGVAEQNMTGVAAGLAMEGKIPVIYSIVPFATMRNFEMIKNDICYQNLNVKIVGVGAGFSYGPYGHTHYGLEDVGVLRTVPGITIFAPGDPLETELVTRAAFKINGPVYIRIGKAKEPVVHKKIPKFKVGKGIILKEGKSVYILATGTMLPTAMQVSELLSEKYSVGVVSMPTIKPIDTELVMKLAENVGYIFSLEEHFIIGGLGSAIAEILAENKSRAIFKRLGVPNAFSKKTGTQSFMREQNDILPDQIVNKIVNKIEN